MNPVPLPDEVLTERLLEARPSPDDLDGAYGTLARLLVIAQDGVDEPIDPDRVLLAEMRAAVIAPVVDLRDRRRGRNVTRTLVIAGVVGFGATAAAAASGSLPDTVQGVAHGLAQVVGVDIPAGSQDGPGHGRSDEAPGRPEDPGADPGSRSDEAPGRPADPGASNSNGVGPDGTAPGQGGTIPGNATGNDGVPPANGNDGVRNSTANPDPGTPPANANPNAGGSTNANSSGAPPGQSGAPPDPGGSGGQGGGAGAGQGSGNANANGHDA